MPLTLVTTAGAATANSYATEAETNTVALELYPEPTAWQVASTDLRQRALVTATRRLDRDRYVGARVDDTQGLEWPRRGVREPGRTTLYSETAIPDRLVRACGLLAIWLVAQVGDPAISDGAGLQSFSFGSDVSMAFEPGSGALGSLETYYRQAIRPVLGPLVYVPQPHLVRG